MTTSTVYQICPTYRKKTITLRQTSLQDAQDLLQCYADEKAVPLFNSDNCDGDDFHYTTLKWMKQTIDFWDFSYVNGYFVHRSVVLNSTGQAVGTIEMFHRNQEDEFNHYGVLRIDLQSKYECGLVLEDILAIVNENFYREFDVQGIITKAIPAAQTSIKVLEKMGYAPL